MDKKTSSQLETTDQLLLQLHQEKLSGLEKEVQMVLLQAGLKQKIETSVAARDEIMKRLMDEYGLTAEDKVDLDTGGIIRHTEVAPNGE